MHKIWVVIRREFVEKVRTKWFVIATVLGPLLMASFIVVPIWMADRGASERNIRVIDVSSDGFGATVVQALQGPGPIQAQLVSTSADHLEAVADSLNTLVGEKRLDGYLIITDATVTDGVAEYRGKNVSSMTDMQILRSALSRELLTARLARAGVPRSVVA